MFYKRAFFRCSKYVGILSAHGRDISANTAVLSVGLSPPIPSNVHRGSKQGLPGLFFFQVLPLLAPKSVVICYARWRTGRCGLGWKSLVGQVRTSYRTK